MSTQQSVLVLTTEPVVSGAVAAALGHNSRFMTNGICRTLGELTSRLERKPAAAALVDIDPDPEKNLANLESIIIRYQNTRFIVLSHELRSEWILSAMHVGARHYLAKPKIAAELHEILDRLVPVRSTHQAMGSVITLMSASGGCGVTTLAVNLAQNLHEMTKQPALLMDLDWSYGAVSTYLGLHGQYGLADVLSHKGKIDPELVKSTACSYSDGLRVIMNPASSNSSGVSPLAYERLPQTLEACRQAFQFTVVDAPRLTLEQARELAMASSLTLMVFQLNVKDVRTAQNMLLNLGESGLGFDRVIPLANRCHKRRTMVSFEDAQQALKHPELMKIRNDFRSAIQAMNYGQTLSESAPRSQLYKDIQELAQYIMKRLVGPEQPNPS